MRNYRELQVLSKAHSLTLDLYRASRAFPREEMYGVTSQLRRAAASIGANLAEGCGRRDLRTRSSDRQFVGLVVADFLHRPEAMVCLDLQGRRSANFWAEWNSGLARELSCESL